MDNDLKQPFTDEQLSLLEAEQKQVPDQAVAAEGSTYQPRTASEWLEACTRSFANTPSQRPVGAAANAAGYASAINQAESEYSINTINTNHLNHTNPANPQNPQPNLTDATQLAAKRSGPAVQQDPAGQLDPAVQPGQASQLGQASQEPLVEAAKTGTGTGPGTGPGTGTETKAEAGAKTGAGAKFGVGIGGEAGHEPEVESGSKAGQAARLHVPGTPCAGENLFKHHALGELAATAQEAAIIDGMNELLVKQDCDLSQVNPPSANNRLHEPTMLREPAMMQEHAKDNSSLDSSAILDNSAFNSGGLNRECTVERHKVNPQPQAGLNSGSGLSANLGTSASAVMGAGQSLVFGTGPGGAIAGHGHGQGQDLGQSQRQDFAQSQDLGQGLGAGALGNGNGSNGNRVIRKAVIVSKVYHRPVGGAIVEIAKLLNRLGVEAYTDQSTAVGFNLDEVPILSRRGMKDTDLIIVVGGDGSVLGASRSLVDLQVPVLGINRGHLGLLTDISPNNLEDALTKVVGGHYTTENRMMIDVRVMRRDEEGSEELIGQSLALNETVIHSGILAHMIVCRVSINGRYMYTLRSDGIIVGTPTGSTAYSLSAGGPIIEPHLDVLCLVPMFPQSLNCSPIILPGKSKVEIEFEIKDSMPEWVNVNCDGQVTIRADTKCLVSIRQHPTQLQLIHPAGYDYYSVLRQKLGWGQSLVN